MKLNDAINASQIMACRGFDELGKCLVSVAYYGGRYVWMTGWGGNWTNEWKPVPPDEMKKLDPLDFQPTGPRPAEPIDDEMQAIYAEILLDEEEGEGPRDSA